jgi:hypothetical protein
VYAFYFFAFEMMIGFIKVSGERLNLNFVWKLWETKKKSRGIYVGCCITYKTGTTKVRTSGIDVHWDFRVTFDGIYSKSKRVVYKSSLVHKDCQQI